MKRDIVIAIGIGFASGALAAVILLNLPQIISSISRKNIHTAQNETISITPQVASSVNLEISEPLDDSLGSSKTAFIKGTTQVGNYIVLENNAFQDIIAASSDGSFVFPVTYQLGSNDMNITAYNKNGDSATKMITVLYQEEKL